MSETDPNRPSGEANRPDNPYKNVEPIPLEPGDTGHPTEAGARARIDSPGLLDDFDEDADLESDPEVERIVKGIPIAPAISQGAPTLLAEPVGEPLCLSTSWRVPVAIGAVVTVGAAVFAAIYAPNVAWAYVLITLYRAAVHTATGVGAVVVAAMLLGRRVGSFQAAAARMFLAVSLFLIVFSLALPLKSGEQTFLRAAGYVGMVLLAAAAYAGGVFSTFRLPPRDVGVIAGAHFGLALLVSLGNLLTGVISGAGAVQ
jgi:hypothetical protein